MLIAKSAVRAYLARDFDSYRWLKKLRRVELLEEMERLRPHPVFRTKPWLHQLVCFFIGTCEPRFLFLLDMGLGKTKILLDLATFFLHQRRLKHALVFVPRLINIETWLADMREHCELEPWAIRGSSIDEKWDRLAYPDGDVTLIDYAGYALATTTKVKAKGQKNATREADPQKIRHLQKTYNWIGLDESHKLGNGESLWYELIAPITDTADRVFATTGTIFSRNPEAIYHQFRLVDDGETFGREVGLFRGAFFKPKPGPFGVKLVYQRSMNRRLHLMMQNKSIRYEDQEVPEIDLPKRLPPIRRYLDLTDEQRHHYLKALEGLINAKGAGDRQLDAPWLRMRQIVSGYLRWNDDYGEHFVPFDENPKLDLLEATLDEIDGKIIIVYQYTHTGQLISQRLKKLNIDHAWLYGGTKDKPATVERFKKDAKCGVFLMNDEAGGTGTDGLQKASHYMIFYESPTSPTARAQVEKRIDRPGQKSRCRFIDLVAHQTGDKKILDDLAEGRDLYESVVSGRFRQEDFLSG